MKACPHGVVAGQCNDCLAQTLETEAAMLAKILEPDREHDPVPAFQGKPEPDYCSAGPASQV